MAFELHWQIPGKVLFRRYYGDTTLSDVRNMIDETDILLEDGLPPVHSIVHVADVTSHPRLDELYKVIDFQPRSSEGWQVVVSPVSIPLMVVTALLKMIGKPFHQAHTVEAALIFLAEKDPALQARNTAL